MKYYLLLLKSIICISVIVTLMTLSGGCSDDSGKNKETQAESTESETEQKISETADYSIEKINGNYYMIFENIGAYENKDQNALATLDFDSIIDFKNTVTNGNLADWQKTVIASAFIRDETGIKICDFNHLYFPELPDAMSVGGVSWSGESYSFFVGNKDVFGYVHYYTEEQYNEIYQRDYEEYFSKDTITLIETEHTEERNAEISYYSTLAGELMQIRYTLQSEGKTFTVDETYRISMKDNALSVSDTVPCSITVYGIENNQYYVIDLFGFSKRPSETWLCSFGLSECTY